MTEALQLNPSGYTPVAPGKIATVVTHLAMHERAPLRPERAPESYALRRVPKPDLSWYRDLYRRVGENWLWFSRLVADDAGLAAIVHDPAVEVHALRFRSRDEGLLELDFRRFPEVEISFLGVAPNLLGKGAGRYLINRAIENVWGRGPNRFTVHTCTLDHPHALEFYLRSGFIPYARSVEVADDPRASGLLARTAAPHVPMILR